MWFKSIIQKDNAEMTASDSESQMIGASLTRFSHYVKTNLYQSVYMLQAGHVVSKGM